jgi:hypothetical protein
MNYGGPLFLPTWRDQLELVYGTIGGFTLCEITFFSIELYFQFPDRDPVVCAVDHGEANIAVALIKKGFSYSKYYSVSDPFPWTLSLDFFCGAQCLKPHCIRCSHFKVDDVSAVEASSNRSVRIVEHSVTASATYAMTLVTSWMLWWRDMDLLVPAGTSTRLDWIQCGFKV